MQCLLVARILHGGPSDTLPTQRDQSHSFVLCDSYFGSFKKSNLVFGYNVSFYPCEYMLCRRYQTIFAKTALYAGEDSSADADLLINGRESSDRRRQPMSANVCHMPR